MRLLIRFSIFMARFVKIWAIIEGVWLGARWYLKNLDTPYALTHEESQCRAHYRSLDDNGDRWGLVWFDGAGLIWLTWFTDCFTPCINCEKQRGISPSISHEITPVYCIFHCIRSTKPPNNSYFSSGNRLEGLCLQGSHCTTERLKQVHLFDRKYSHSEAR